MPRSLALPLILILAAVAPLRAQVRERPQDTGPSVTAFGGYMLEYERVLRQTGFSEQPGSRTFGVPAGPAAGLGLRIALKEWVGVDAGMLYRPAQRAVPVCDRTGGSGETAECGAEGDVGYLFALRFGGYLAVPLPLPVSLAATPMIVRQGLLDASKPEWEAGVSLALALAVPLGSPSLAGQLAVERHYVRGSRLVSSDPRFTEEAPWQPTLLRVGLVVTPGADEETPRRRLGGS